MATEYTTHRVGLGRIAWRKTLAFALALAVTVTITVTMSSAWADEPGAGGSGTQATEAQLEDAQARLEQAAREIAELAARVVGDVGITAMSRIEEMARGPRPVMLGINIGPVGGPEAREDGVQILGVTPGSAAEEAGIRSGDVLLAIGDVALTWNGDHGHHSPVDKLLDVLRNVEPGARLELQYRRDNQMARAAVAARAWSWPQAFAHESERMLREAQPGARAVMRRFMMDRWGDMEMVALTPELGEYFQAGEGVLVVRAPASDLLGLRDGDVIVDIAGRTPADPGHVVRILRSYAPGERLVMTVVRKGQREQLEADIPE